MGACGDNPPFHPFNVHKCAAIGTENQSALRRYRHAEHRHGDRSGQTALLPSVLWSSPLEVLHGDLRVGTFLQARQLDGLLGSQGGCDEQQGGYDKRLRIIHN